MRDGRNLRPLFLPNLEHLHHEGDGVVFLEPFADGFSEYARGRRGERIRGA